MFPPVSGSLIRPSLPRAELTYEFTFYIYICFWIYIYIYIYFLSADIFAQTQVDGKLVKLHWQKWVWLIYIYTFLKTSVDWARKARNCSVIKKCSWETNNINYLFNFIFFKDIIIKTERLQWYYSDSNRR